MLKHYVIVIVVEFDYVIVVDVLNLSHNGRKMVKLDFKLTPRHVQHVFGHPKYSISLQHDWIFKATN